MKSYTDIEQSKKLAEILPLTTADMCYVRAYFEGKQSDWFIQLGAPIKSDDIIPCWSLAALLDILHFDLNTASNGQWIAMIPRDGEMRYEYNDNPVDACYELILKLKEQNLL